MRQLICEFGRRTRPWTLLILLLSSCALCWGIAAAQQDDSDQYKEKQLKDPAFVASELDRVVKLRAETEKKLAEASPLLQARIRKDLKKVEAACELLEYIRAHGYDPKSEEMQRLEYFKTSKTLDIVPGLEPSASTYKMEPDDVYAAYHGQKYDHPISLDGTRPVNLKHYLAAGKTTIFFIASDGCHDCVVWRRALENLHEYHKPYAVVRITLANVDGQTDFRSPAARQLSIDSVPYFLIYSPAGTLDSRGDEAREKLRNLLNGYGIPQRKGAPL